MNKQVLFSVIFLVYFTTTQLFSEVNMVHYMDKSINHGSQTYGKETVEEIQANGFVKLDGTKVTSYLQVNGCLKAENAQIEEMQINGQASLDRCLVKQKSVVCGALSASDSKFSDDLSVSSERTSFNSCALSSLHILQVGGYHGVQVVELRGKTKINGNISFESGNGEVIAGPNVEITGDIIGGRFRK